jgi:hypothetical protein
MCYQLTHMGTGVVTETMVGVKREEASNHLVVSKKKKKKPEKAGREWKGIAM